MKIQLVADSSANILAGGELPVAYAPLKIITTENEYVDDAALDTAAMMTQLREYKGRTTTACPSVSDWIMSFDGADAVLGVAITSGLSGSYNSAHLAAEEYEESNPGARVFILDSLSTGPEMQLILEKYSELAATGMDFDAIVAAIRQYHSRTHLYFALSSLDNLAKNGRVNPIVAKAAGVLGIRVVGRASAEGTLEPMNKRRGEKKALRQLISHMLDEGYTGGKLRLTHSNDPAIAETFAAEVREVWPQADISIAPNGGLCCFYAEEGSLLVGFET